MLGADEADADGAEGDRLAGLLGGVGVGAHGELGRLTAPLHELHVVLKLLGLLGDFVVADEAGDDLGRSGLDLARVNEAGGAVDGEEVAFLEDLAVDGGGLRIVVDDDAGGAADADLAHLAGNEGGVRGDTTASGEDTLGGNHAAEIFRGGLDANEENLLALFSGEDGAVGVEVDLAGGGAGAGGKAGGDDLGLLHFGEIEDRGEQLFELVGRVAENGGFPVDELLLDHVGGELEAGGGGAFAVTRLEHEQLAFLDGELDVLHILEVLLEGRADLEELGVGLGHDVLELEHGLGGAHACDDVFALGVDEEFAVELVGAVRGVAGERNAGAGGLAGVTEHHGLDVNGGAPLGGDVVFAAIDDRAVVHPRSEHGAGGSTELVPSAVREGFSGALFDEGLEALDELLLVFGGEVGIDDVAVVGLVFERVDGVFKRIVIFAGALLDAHDDVAIHLDEAAIAVVGEAGVTGGFFQGDDGLVVEAEVENSVHHAGHGVAGAGAHGHEEGHAGLSTEGGAHDLFHVAHAGFHLGLEGGGVGALVGVIIGADLGRDGEAGRHGKTDAGHLGEVGALAAKEGFHAAVAIGFAGAPRVNIFGGLLGGGFFGGGRLGDLRGDFLGGFFSGHILGLWLGKTNVSREARKVEGIERARWVSTA